jgi:hypothetical protein
VIPHPTDPSLALVPLTKGLFAIISMVDFNDVGQGHWQARRTGRATTYYAGRSVFLPGEKQKTLLLHRLIASRMGLPVDRDVDHENGNGLDCRRSNLRSATCSENMWNSRAQAGTKTGVKGVNLQRGRDGSADRYRARLSVNGSDVFVGNFDTLDAAAAAVASARLRLHGAFANHGEHRA